MTEETIAQIHLPVGERKLEAREALAVSLVEKLAEGPEAIDDVLRAELSVHFSPAEVVELSMMIGQYIAFGRQLRLLGLDKGACEIYATGD